MFRVFITLIFLILIIFVPRLIPKTQKAWIKDEEGKKVPSEIDPPFRKYILPIRLVLGAFAFFLIFSTSYVIIDANSVGHLKRIYLGKSMVPGQIIAFPGQKGPQAEILPPGFHFRLLLNVLFDVEERPVLEKVLRAAVENPDIVKIPQTLVTGTTGGLEGAAAILGSSNIAGSLGQGLQNLQKQQPPSD